MQVLSGSGIESEAHVPFAALHQIVRPILGRLECLPEPRGAHCGERSGSRCEKVTTAS